MDKEEIVSKLIEKNIRIGSAESLTGGLFSSTITSIPGVSKIFKGSIVSYSTLIKENVLKIDRETIDKYGVISHEIAEKMCRNAKDILDVDMALSFTGNAGPDAMEGKPVGRVYIGICYKDSVETYEFNFDGNREEIRHKCIEKAFELIKMKIL